MSQGARRWSLIAVLAIVAGGVLVGAWESWTYRRSRRAMAEAIEEIEAGRHSTAARKLIALLAERPGSDEAAYLLGTCEKASGRDRAAAEAWAACGRGRRSRRGRSSASWRWKSTAVGSPPPSNSSNGPWKTPATMRPPCPSTSGPSTGSKVASKKPGGRSRHGGMF